jgi:NOL1/NOP2/fmu family ribosome biogenesis protein
MSEQPRPIIPPAFLARMERWLGDEYPAFLASYDQPATNGLRANTLKIAPAALRNRLPFALEPLDWPAAAFRVAEEEQPGQHPYHAAGLYYLQDPSAMSVAALLAPLPGERVLDDCDEGTSAGLRRAVRLWPHTGPGEGHFIALLRRRAGETHEDVPAWRLPKLPVEASRFYKTFCREHLLGEPATEGLALVGSYLYQVPAGLPDLGGLRFIHPGWWLGTLKKGRFEPSQGLAMGLRPADVRQVTELDAAAPQVLTYLRGESLTSAGADGWVLVTVDGFPLGWGKRVQGTLKSHYPRGLRRV